MYSSFSREYSIKNNYDWGYGFFFIALFSILLALGAMKRTTVSTEIAIAYLARLGMCILCTVQNDGDADNYAVNAINYAAMPLGEVFLNVPMGPICIRGSSAFL